MRRTTLFCIAGAVPLVTIVACGASDPAPTTPAPGTDPYAAYYPPTCDPSQPGCVPAAQPGYAPTAPPGYAPTAYPTAPAPAAGPMAVPGALALPCSADSACILGRCNTQYSKCAFPCQTAADCATGAACNALSGLCLPGG